MNKIAGTEIQERRKVLLIEDNEINRDMMAMQLEEEYEVLTAENGKEGLDMLREYGSNLSLIILDIEMPIMNGHEFMAAVQEENIYTNIPIIVATANDSLEDEVKCLELGASDFIGKGDRLEGVVDKRVASLIRLCETTKLLHRIENDPVTDAYIKEAFMEYVRRITNMRRNDSFDIICFEIGDYWSLLDRYGAENCNALQREFCDTCRKIMGEALLIGKLDESQTVILTPHVDFETHKRRIENEFTNKKWEAIPTVIIKGGIYENINHDYEPEVLCRNALMALDTMRNNYGNTLALFNDSMREKIEKNNFIIDNMWKAIREEQFHAYYQPKYDAFSEKIAGAEALIRWTHPELGFISPGEFVPIFEHNGFVYELDKYMLKKVCKDVRRWLDEGKNVVPISVNVSQLDFDQPGLVETYEEIIDGQDIPHELIHFEVTETMESADSEKKKEILKRFSAKGFILEMDDFGSGFSTLNTLGELPIDYIKVDKQQVQNIFDYRYERLLKTILFAASELDLSLVAEGVETKEQLEALKTICKDYRKIYVQGFYFCKPIACAEFEKLLEA